MWPPLRIWHAGAVVTASENSCAALDSALRDGAEAIVIEVRVSAAGDPVINHHAPLKRTVGGEGDAENTCGRIGSLADILLWVREQKCMAFVAIDNANRGAEATVVNEIARAKVLPLTRVIACDVPGLRRLCKLDAKVHLGLRFSGRPPALRQVKALGAEVLLPHRTAAPLSFIHRAHQAQMLVIPWTVDSPREIRRAVLEGVDGIITKHLANLAEAVASLRNIWPAERQGREQPGFSVFSAKNSSSLSPLRARDVM
jgi:glycerophosphoryl diester phosphodiesterase